MTSHAPEELVESLIGNLWLNHRFSETWSGELLCCEAFGSVVVFRFCPTHRVCLFLTGGVPGLPREASSDHSVWPSLQGWPSHSDHWWGSACHLQRTPTYCKFQLMALSASLCWWGWGEWPGLEIVLYILVILLSICPSVHVCVCLCACIGFFQPLCVCIGFFQPLLARIISTFFEKWEEGGCSER